MKLLLFCNTGFEMMEFAPFVDVFGWARNDYGDDVEVVTCGFTKQVTSTFGVMLDGGGIEIGDHVLFGPRVGIYTSNHAVDAWERVNGACYARPVKIGNHVWVGAGVHINPGVTIGDNTIIGSGSVITKDIPANVIAAGVPCKVIREITEADKTGYRP